MHWKWPITIEFETQDMEERTKVALAIESALDKIPNIKRFTAMEFEMMT